MRFSRRALSRLDGCLKTLYWLPVFVWENGFLNIYKSKNIQLTVTKSGMVNWNEMFNVRKYFGGNWFRGKPSMKGSNVTFPCFLLGLNFGTITEHIFMVDGLKNSLLYRLVPFVDIIYERTTFKTSTEHFIELAFL